KSQGIKTFMNQSSTEPSVHYDRITLAWRYLLGDNLHYGYFSRPTDRLDSATEALTRHMANAADLGPACRVLDIGCGIGQPAAFLARQVQCRVLGISTSAVGIETASRLAAAHGLTEQVEFEVRDGMRTGLADASFE